MTATTLGIVPINRIADAGSLGLTPCLALPRRRAAARRVRATNSSSRRLPSRRFSIDVAYEIRTKPGASNASPGVTATRDSSSSASANSMRRAEARRRDSTSLMSTNR